MYATVGDAVPEGEGWTFEPKFDGMRVLAHVGPRGVRLVTRNGKEKQAQFPEVVAALERLAARIRRPLVLDGEVVALEEDAPGRFQTLQQRMHLKDLPRVAEVASEHPAALLAFDLLALGDDALLGLPWHARRAALERLVRDHDAGALRVAESTEGAQEMLRRAKRGGWEGVIAKRTDALYVPGARSRDWLKLKLQYRAEFVVGGFTEPRNAREHLGALLLGYYEGERFVYAGHTGGGFDRAGLQAMYRRLRPLVRVRPAFADPPRTNERAHWVKPSVVVEVKFAEWTADGRLRQPIFLGTRDDKPAREVTREATSLQEWGMAAATRDGATTTDADTKDAASRKTAGKAAGKAAAKTAAKTAAKAATKSGRESGSARPAAKTRAGRIVAPEVAGTGAAARLGASVVEQLVEIERDGGEGELTFGRGRRLHVSSLGKAYYPDAGVTKGDVMRYYAAVSPLMLPLLADRPLALTRFPEGIAGHKFYQQKAPEGTPDVVRVERIAIEGDPDAERIVGCDLPTLLYLVQMGTLVLHSWFSRIDTLDEPDFSLIDLDPGEGVAFRDVVRMARAVRGVTDGMGLSSAVKTSGSRGIHIAIPLPKGADYATSAALALRVAEVVAQKMPELATLERRIAKRPEGTILLDVMQNARGKHMVAPYTLRARPDATVSAPLVWTEVGTRLTMERFTVQSMPRRVARAGDHWGIALRGRNGARAIAAALRA